MKKVTTLAIIEKDNKILLAMKKRGFGKGWWNGYGGKVDSGETITNAMIRELLEESGLLAIEYKPRGIINFHFEGSDLEVEMHLFEVTKYSGELIETDEMCPSWFKKDNIPYDKMWPADRQWISLFLNGKSVYGEATFDSETKRLISSEFSTD